VDVVRSSLRFVTYSDSKPVAADLKSIYSTPTDEAALGAFDEFSRTWEEKYRMINMSWTNRWTETTPFLNYPEEIRLVMYTTKAIESVNHSLRKVSRDRLALPTTDAAMKLCFMATKFDGRVPV
jgi:putative transposase